VLIFARSASINLSSASTLTTTRTFLDASRSFSHPSDVVQKKSLYDYRLDERIHEWQQRGVR
jgi:hypothetical protein